MHPVALSLLFLFYFGGGKLNHMSFCLQGDILSLEDLTYEKRKEFLAKYPLPADVPVICFHTEASRTPRAVSVMSHIAHAQLPWLPGIARGRTGENSDENAGGAKLHVAVPLAAAMAICALHLELRYKEKSDGLVTRKDSEVPGSIVVKPEKKLDHAWMVYAPSRREPNEPDAAQMCEALIAVLLHHPRWRRRDAPVETQGALQEAGEAAYASCAATMAQNHDPNDFLTTDAARSFLADTEDEVCTSGDTYLKHTHDSDVDRLTAGSGLSDQEGTSSKMEGVQSLQLQRQISDIVVLDAIAHALQGDIGNARVLSEQSQERDPGTAPDTKEKMVDDTPTIEDAPRSI